MQTSKDNPLEVLIIGGGVAAFEGALALRALAGDKVAITMLAPEQDFVYRPLRVREPFNGPEARRYPLAALADDIGFTLKRGAFQSLSSADHVVHTSDGEALHYDALLLGLGAQARPAFEHVTTLNDAQLDDQLHGIVRDVEHGCLGSVAFIAPDRSTWPLPMYELALMTARRAWEMDEVVDVIIVTPEPAPLALFGDAASDAVADLLQEVGIQTYVDTHCDTPRGNELQLSSGRTLHVGRVIAMPELVGPLTPGIPKRSEHAFIPIDSHCRVPGLDAVFAAGDATDFPVKQGGIAAQQADVAAASIAALAGADVEPVTLEPVVHGLLLGGKQPLYMTANMGVAHGPGRTTAAVSEVSTELNWSPLSKISAKYLAPYFESLDSPA